MKCETMESEQKLTMTDRERRKGYGVSAEPRRKQNEMLMTYPVNGAPYVDFPCVHQLIERQVVLRPHAIALVYEEQTITYADLNTRANRIAHRLIELSVLPDDCVGLCVARSPAMIIGMLAILKAGGAYVPIDPAYSSARSARILGDACPKILLSDRIGQATLNKNTIDALTVIDPNILPNLPMYNPEVSRLTSEDLAHVIYTSGSTGIPKGVMVEHRNIVQPLSCCQFWFNFDPNDTWSLSQSISFGYSTWTLWGSLCSGAKMVIVSHEISRAPLELQRIISDKKITILSLTPSVLRVYITQYCLEPRADTLKYIILAGERFNARILMPWYTLRDDNSPQIVNCYGATEMTLFASYKLLKKQDVNLMISPVGTRSVDSTLYLLDDNCMPVSNGEVGEICVDGGGVARGYWSRPDLTSERFLVNPFSEAFDARMYRTGDMAYYQDDGSLAFVGRNDQQLKIRGFRIEPCEIEARLIAHPAVRQAHVLVISSEYVDRLVAYVVAEVVDNLQVILHEHMSAQLPEYMVPSSFVQIDEFPLNQSGKIDRSVLPELDEKTLPLQAFEEPQGEIERELANIWRKLLGLRGVGRHDSFFSIGGHSLIVPRIIEHMRSLGWNLTIGNLFQYPVLSELATTVTRQQGSVIEPNFTSLPSDLLALNDLTEMDIAEIIEKVPGGIDNIQDIYALSPLQDGILFHYLLNPEADPYIIRTIIEFASKDILQDYLSAFQCMVDRHDILRTSFVWDGVSVPAQVVWRRAQLSVIETSLNVDMNRINSNSISWFDSRDIRINLEQAPLVKFMMMRAESGSLILIQIIHHLIGDEKTIGMMHVEMKAYLNGQKDLPQVTPYRNLISKMRSTVDHDAYMQFFTEMLSDVDTSTFPFGLRDVLVNEMENVQSQQTLDPKSMQNLRRTANNFNVSLATLCHVTWAVIISRACDQDRVVFGTVLSGRMQTGGNVDSAMGLYVNTLPLRLDIDDTPVVESLLRTHLTIARLLEYEYASLASIQRCSSIVGGAPLFSSLLNVRNHLSAVDLNHYPAGIKFHGTVGYTNYPLVLIVDYDDSEVVLTAQIMKPICSKRVCGYMQRALESLDEALERTPRSPVRCLEILPEQEKMLLLEPWSDTEKLEPNDDLCIHRIFEARVGLAPNATALIFGKHKITYGELNIRANRLAHKLIKLGIEAEERVAFCLDRTPEMIVSILAILKAGGAYVPIDPAYACERVSHVLDDAEPKIILTDVTGRNAMKNIDVSGSIVLDLVSETEFSNVNPMIPEHNSRCLAYIIYTSGSTTEPKGVMIEHRDIVRYFHSTADLFHFKSNDIWSLNSSIGYDVSMWEIWGALCSGSEIVIVSNQVSRSAEELVRLICQHHVTILNLTPTAFVASIDTFSNSSIPNELRFIILTGEKLEPSVLNSWYAVFDDTAPQLMNMYGVTETTIFAMYKALTKQDAESTVSPIGERLPDTKLYLLDTNGQPVPFGAVGEIYLGGIGIGRGYVNRLELTNERFLADPFSGSFDARMYRTGDIAYHLKDRSLAYVSRNDQQVKIRGIRVELGEIEACISNHPAVKQARVLIVSNDCIERLVAYVISKSGGNLTMSFLDHVSKRLPEYMVPSAFVVLDEFPLTRNGKLDHRALPPLSQTFLTHRVYEEPQGSIGIELDNIRNLTDSSAQIEEKLLHSIEMISDTESEDFIKTRNSTSISYPDSPCIHHIFEQHAIRRPQATAISYAQKELTYAELNHRANRLAHHLIDSGVSEGERVALCVERSLAMIIGILAILKAGATYVPVDPAHLSQRSLYILTDAGPKIALVDGIGRVALSNVALAELKLIDPDAAFAFDDVNPVLPALRSSNVAYIIYTSGTTGKPKGVMVQHRNVVQLLSASGVHFLFDQRDTWCLIHSIAFDFSVWELWGALCNGGKLIIVPRDISRSSEDLRELVWDQGVTVMNFTPNAFREFANTYVFDSEREKLRYIIFGGEKLDCSILKSWYATHSGTSPQLVNMYGITETTVHATYRLLNQTDTNQKNSVIGRSLSHNTIYVLDSERRPVPFGIVGEIYVGGAGVTSGYSNHNDLTKNRFLSDPFSDALDARMYQTGDLAYYLRNSDLAYVGRNDKQVKVRGFRIEVVEIENCLMEHSLVHQALVRVIENQEYDNLVAYVIADAVQNLNVELREHASVHLPEYMVPSAFVRLDEFPLTQNGKIDHLALPLPDETAFASQTYEEPCTPLEIELATIWRNLLKIDRIGRQDSFFALGGHSLLAVRVIEQLRARGWELSVRDLFNHPILHVLANSITRHEERQVPPNLIDADTRILTPDMLPLIELSQSEIDSIIDKVPGGLANIQDIYALSPLQEGILFHNLLASGDDPYLVSHFMRFTDRNLLDRYLSAFQRMIDRHDILRTAFVWKDLSTPAQVVWRRAMLSISEITLTPEGESVYDQFRSDSLDQRSHGIDLDRAPLLRFFVTRDRSGCWLARQQTHHLIGDETTIRSMSIELRAQMTGAELPSATPYRNLVHTMRIKSSREATVQFFTGMLRDIVSPTLPFGLKEIHTNHAQITDAQRILATDSMVRLRSETRNLNVGVATVIHVAWALVLSRVCDQRHVIFGTVLFGRMHTGRGSSSAMGLYINTLPLRVDIDNISVDVSIRKVHNSLADLLEHEHASLVLAQRCSSIPSGQPLFSSLLNFRHHQVVEGSMNPPGIQSIEIKGYTNYPLLVSIDDDESAVRLSTEVVRPIDPDRICMYMQQAVYGLIDTVASSPAIPLRSLEVLPSVERAMLLEKWNEVEAQIDLPCIHQLFEQQVLRMGNAIAIVSGNEEISYVELNIRANKLAHQLITVGVLPGKRVGLCVSRSPAMIVGMIAILKAGGAYVPIDPDHASERLSYILNDADPSIVLADRCGMKVLDHMDSTTFVILDPDIMTNSPHNNPLISEVCSENLAYIMYTSGTTGKPKGVMVRHHNIVRFLDGTESWSSFNADDIWCLHHSIAFDFSVWELWGPFSKGAKIIILSQEVALSPPEIWRIIREREVTILTLTPNAFGLFKDFDSVANRLRYIIFGGEKLEYKTLQWWFSVHGDTLPQLVNTYGPTETTINATYRLLTIQDLQLTTSPIGKKLSHNKMYLLDSCKKPVPPRAIGEIYIGGAGVASGYLNRHDLTAERFLPDLFSDAFDAKMYRTGDSAYQLEDGEFVYIGRSDQQIKVRGFRIEPSEIEACLTSHPKVCQALVRIIDDGEFDRLIAYVKAKISDDLTIELRDHASKKLPEYMVPSAFVVLEEFPLTRNGKIDCSALPSVSVEAFASQAYEKPRGEVEIKLAEIWCRILDIERVGRYDSFFALGGHSLLAMRLIENLSVCGWKLKVRDLYNHPVLSQLASIITQDQRRNVPPNIIDPSSTTLTPEMLPLIELTQSDIDIIVSKVPGGLANIQDIYALSPLQEGILFHNLLAKENDPYLIINFIEFDDRSCFDRYLDAIQRIVNRQDILRTSFVCDTVSVPAQVVWRHASISITETSVSSNDDLVYDGFKVHCIERRRCGIDLESAPLLRFEVTRGNSGHWLACQFSHHLIGDATTLQAMYAEVQAHLGGEDPPTMTPYRNLVHFMRTESNREDTGRFFANMLCDIEDPTLPFGLNSVHINRAQNHIFEQRLAEDLILRLRAQTRKLNITSGSLFHVAWALVLSRICDQHQVVFGTVLFGRMHAGGGIDTAMGLYINTLPFRVDVDKTPVQVALRKVHNNLADLLEHEHASLVFAQRCSAVPGGQSLFSSLLNFRQQRPNRSFGCFTGINFLETVGNTNFPLNVSIDDDGSTLYLTIDALRPAIPERLCAYILKAVEGITGVRETMLPTPLRSLQVLPEEEQHLMIKTWNMTTRHSPDTPCIHNIFEQQVLRTSDAIALVYEDERISYSELNHRANRLAHQLIISGVSPEQTVGLCTGRTPAMIVGILAILKAGGAYVPVDPAYACERLSYILDDADPQVVVADKQGEKSLRSTDLVRFKLLDPEIESNYPETNPLIRELCSTNLAYVIYTSGTTGKPKGVMIQHRNIVQLIGATDPWFQFHANDTWCLYHSIAFDVAVWEVWGCLSKGAKLIIVPQNVSRSPENLWRLLWQQHVSVLNLTPSAFQLLGVNDCLPNRLRYIIFAGEKLEHSTLRRWYSKHDDTSPQLVNMYGLTETTVHATYRLIAKRDVELPISPIGERIPNNKIYLLDLSGQPVPLGAIGEVHIGGSGVACGYLNRFELTKQRFVLDSFSDAFNAKMYRTGDCAYHSESGELIYVGRNDDQIKIRGFRVEPSEIEACLISHPQVREALVRVKGNGEFRRLVAYVVGTISGNSSAELREYASTKLPEYMVPSAFIMIDQLHLTQNGKIDRLASPAPDQNDLSTETYEEPQVPIEIELARIWGELLGIDRISRRDSFFALGGNSLHAVRMTERMKCSGWKVDVRDLFEHPILFELANHVVRHQVHGVPPNVLSPYITELTPEMFPLIDLTQSDIEKIISEVPGGVSNIQDIYALSPLQDGLLFHNLLAPESDPYNLICRMSFDGRNLLDRYLTAVQLVVDRHDILRTSFIWEKMTVPAQVVWRVATISVEEIIELPDDHSSSVQISTTHSGLQPCHVSLNRAPLLRYLVLRETSGDWILTELFHHLIMDHSSLELVHGEIRAFLNGKNASLPEPSPFRKFIAEVKFGVSQKVHERFFSEMLANIDEPTMPYGISQIYRDGAEVTESSALFDRELNKRLRDSAQDVNVSLTTIFHVACASLISVTSSRNNVVFGSVLMGRMKTDVQYDSTLGLFINTLPVRVNVDGTSIRTALEQTHNLLARLFDHEHASLALAQRCSGVANGMPLFTALLNYRHNKPLSVQPCIMPGIKFLTSRERTNYPVIMSVEDFGTQLGLTTQVVHPISSERFRCHMQQAVICIADALEQQHDVPVHSINVLTCEERTDLLKTRNCTENEFADLCCIHRYFELQAERTSAATALVYADQKMTYAELNNRANQLARELINLGVLPGEPVGLCIGRTPALIVGVLAILKAGGAYVPVDPAYSSERLLYILDDATPRVVLADELGRTLFRGIDFMKFTIVDPNIESIFPEMNPIIPELSSTNLAYIMYTSGTSGQPKGVMVQHRNIVRLFSATDPWFHFNADDTWCLYNSIAFDVSVWDLWGSLSKGAKLIIVPQDVFRSPRDMWTLLLEQNVTVLNLTPSAFRLLEIKESSQTRLRSIIFIGEKLEYSTLQWWYSTHGNIRAQLVNMYGPTETTVYATYRPIVERDVKLTISPIGKRLSDNKIYLLDSFGQPVPLGAVGEIYVGGSGVASGYFNRYDLTRQRFLPDSFSDAFDSKMYRTGDLAYQLEDSELVYIGRNDEQIKLRGFRIEPHEIETCLISHPKVRQALVHVTSDGEFDRLVAYVVAETTDSLLTELRETASTKLPEYMVPSAFVILAEFPLTQNGKIDRSALPSVSRGAFAIQTFEEPRLEVEIKLAEIWSEVLGIDRVGRNDSFFALGGHSLHIVRILERMRALGWNLKVRDLFENPVLSEVARTAIQHKDSLVPTNEITRETTFLTPDMLPLIDLTQTDIDRIITKVPGGISNIQDIYALSPLQDGLLFHNLLTRNNDPYYLMSRIAFADSDLLHRYTAALQVVVNRHDILRTAIVWEGLTVPAQVVWRIAPLLIQEIPEISTSLRSPEHFSGSLDPRQYPIDLEKAPLSRYIIMRESSGRWILNELIHHLIIDHGTLELIHHEIHIILSGNEINLADSSPFRNYIHEVRRGMSQEAHEHFFRDMLSNIDEATVPFGISDVYRDGSNISEWSAMLPSELNSRLRVCARCENVSLATIFHVVYALLISASSGQRRVVYGTVLLGKMMANIRYESTMGLFINTLPFCMTVDETTVRKCLKETHCLLARLADHEHASLGLAQRCSDVASNMPLFTALLNYRRNVLSSNSAELIPGIEVLRVEERTNYPVGLSIDDFVDQLGLTAHAVRTICVERLIGYVERATEGLANALERERPTFIQDIDILPSSERKHQLATTDGFEQRHVDVPCIHYVFERQVATSPRATALVFDREEFTYAEVNARANGLANQLIEFGVGRGDRVVLCVERTPTMVIAILAILKTGAAYVPIDATYSSERSSQILNDASPKIALVDNVGRTALNAAVLAGLTVFDPNDAMQIREVNTILPGVNSKDLIHVIYTSGSTGKPKGVLVEHRNVARMISNTDMLFPFEEKQTGCLVNSIAFDVSVWELWRSLCRGAKLFLASRLISRSPQNLHKFIRDQKIRVLMTTPNAFGELARVCPNNILSDELRFISLGGEKLDCSTLRSWYAIRSETTPQIVNMYGITESTVVTTYRPLTKRDVELTCSPIGTCLPESKIYLLDIRRRQVPLGAIGEMYIAGAGVAVGYLNQPDLTKERFLTDPFSDAFDARMYRTGDLAYYMQGGGLAYVGRNDEQVKIRGFRIEPSEVESCLVRHPAVHRAYVRVISTESIDRLVAYIVAETIDDSINVLRQHVESQLPEYMVPSAFIQLAGFPLTQNGKIDVRSLPAPEQQDFATKPFETPQGTIELIVAITWGQLLGIESVGRRDDFFVLGGHSLLAVRMMSLLAYRGIICTLNDLFQFPVLADFALKISPDVCLPSRDAAVSVRSSGTEPPLFCVPTGLGDFSYAFALSSHIRSSCPIYALPWPSFRDAGVQDMRELAEYTFNLMRTVQPQGPYRICGYSSGGILAYCVAEIVSYAKETISFVGLIDTWGPSFLDNNSVLSENDVFIKDLTGKWGSNYADKMGMIRNQIDGLDLISCIELAQKLQLYPENVSSDSIAKRLRQPLFYEQMVRQYKPERLQLTIHLFRAAIPSSDNTRMSESSNVLDDDSIGWSVIVPNSLLRIIPIHGDHISIVEDRENRLSLCQSLCAAIDYE